MTEYNLDLKPWRGVRPSNKGGAGNIEHVDDVRNIVWQTRAAPPTDYESALAEALSNLFREGVTDLPGIVDGLNGAGIHGPEGKAWTEQSFCDEMARLGR